MRAHYAEQADEISPSHSDGAMTTDTNFSKFSQVRDDRLHQRHAEVLRAGRGRAIPDMLAGGLFVDTPQAHPAVRSPGQRSLSPGRRYRTCILTVIMMWIG